MVVVSHVRRAYRFCNTIPEPFMPRRKAAAVPLAHAAPTTPAGRSVIPIRHQTLTGMTLDALRERIRHGEYPEGAPLRQDAIANELGVSRIPVREALRQLEAEGLCEGGAASDRLWELLGTLIAIVEFHARYRGAARTTPSGIPRGSKP